MKQLGKALCSYARKITPSNWHVYTDPDMYKSLAGVLNIHLLLIDTTPSERLDWERENGITMPTALTRALTYKRTSRFTENTPRDIRQTGSNKSGAFANTEIWLLPNLLEKEGQDIFATVVHELAHVAVSRLLARKFRPYRDGHINVVNSVVMLEENQHGPTYQKALRRMALRIESTYGKGAAREVWQELASL